MSALDKSRVEIKLGDYGVAPATALSDPSLLPRVQEYRRQSGSRMYPLDKDDIQTKIATAEYHVSRKVDGEFTVLVFQDGQAFTLNPGGTVRVGLPWIDEAAQLLASANIDEAMIAGELYVAIEDRRPRVHDVTTSRRHDVTTVTRQPQSTDDLGRLQFAVFDVISLNGERRDLFPENWNWIETTFSKSERIHPVEAKSISDPNGIEELSEKWVEKQGAEGLVVRSETAGTYKIKPRHTLDVVVLGFTESLDERQGLLHDLLVGVIRNDGLPQVLCRVGGGFYENQQRELLSDLKDMVVDSEYAEVNSDHVAYQMVRPEWVIEISCLDLVAQTTRGGPVNRMILEFNESDACYQVVRRLPLAAVISPQFIRKREDKSVTADDVRIAQVTDIVEVPKADRDARKLTLPQSEILSREVYTKQLKGETMVRKFLVLKTNKETESDEFPAFVVHYTDFSPNRKEPLSLEVRVSNSEEQILSLRDQLKESNIKKGWEPFAAGDASDTAATTKKTVAEKETSVEKPSKKKVAKKATKKKTTKKVAESARTRKKSAKKSG